MTLTEAIDYLRGKPQRQARRELDAAQAGLIKIIDRRVANIRAEEALSDIAALMRRGYMNGADH